MALAIGCASGRDVVFVTVDPFAVPGGPGGDGEVDRGVVLTGRAARALVDGLVLDDEPADLSDRERITHELRIDVGGRRAWYSLGDTPDGYATPDQQALIARLAPALAGPHDWRGWWVIVPVSVPPADAIAALRGAGLPAFVQPDRRRSPWVEVRWAEAVGPSGDPRAVEARLEAQKDAFTTALGAASPGAVAFQSSGGSSQPPGGPTEVQVMERYQLPFGADLRAVEVLARADGAVIVDRHDPERYWVAAWTLDEGRPAVPAPLALGGPYFPIPD
ncbi:MAG: hypothetical protein ABMB14_09700 [Myxococcota bacterium]